MSGLAARKIFAEVQTASQCAALFPKTTEAISAVVEDAKKRAIQTLDSIYSISPSARTFENTAVVADRAAAELGVSASILSVVMSVSPDKAIRDEASKQVVELESFAIDQFEANKKLYEALKNVSESESFKKDSTSPSANAAMKESAYWLDNELQNYRRKGMDLPDEAFQKVIAVQKQLAAISTDFSKNISDDNTQIEVSVDAMTGVPESVVANLNKTSDGSKYILKMDYPTYFGVMKNCEVAETRKAMATAFNNRAYPKNVDLLRELISKRHELATLLGYASYSNLNLDNKMAKTPEVAAKFVADLVPGLQKKWEKELELLKKHLHPSCQLTPEGEIANYDIVFLINQIKKTELNVSETTIQEYFPLDVTVDALFRIYQSFFDVTFTRYDNGGELWFPETSTLAVKDNKTGTLLGHIILDLFPREGKYSHACCHSAVPPVLIDPETNTFSPALSVVIANFPAATETQPALFLHDDVETFFHEFGHAIHGLMGRSYMATNAGTNVKLDFVELPSQMLEEWLWEPEILQMISSHYKTKEPLPKELIDAKIASKNAFSGRDSLRQMQFATYSLEIFGVPFAATTPPSALDTTALFRSIEPRIMPGIKYASDTHFECAFGHLTGYGAGYYGYMWSEVFAQDVFEYIRQHNGLLDPAMGKRYVENIIGVGGGKDPNEMLEAFLGRKPNSDAFLKKLGV